MCRTSLAQLSFVCGEAEAEKTNNRESSSKEETVFVYKCQCLCSAQSLRSSGETLSLNRKKSIIFKSKLPDRVQSAPN